MRYGQVIPARFIKRPNRFVAVVTLPGEEEPVTVHVKNTGRCRELLPPGAQVWLECAANPLRKTRYDLIAVAKERPGELPPLMVNMDSQVPNQVAAEWLPRSGFFSAQAVVRREVTWGKSRFDLLVEDGPRRCFVEVKGVTLEQDGVAMFPDAPTLRGVKHLRELVACHQDGYESAVLFVIQMKGIKLFKPHAAIHPEFAQALREAAAAGVKIWAMDCQITPETIEIDRPVPVEL